MPTIAEPQANVHICNRDEVSPPPTFIRVKQESGLGPVHADRAREFRLFQTPD